MKHDPIREKLTRARAALILDNPFYGQLALRLKLVEDGSIPTLAVDGKHVFYNPEFVDGLSASLTKSAMAHEVMHCVFEHMARRGGRGPKKWNHAGDYVINLVLKDSGFEIGKGWLLDPQYAGMSTDHVYSLLPEPEDDGGGGGPQDECRDATPEEREEIAAQWQVATIQAANTAKAQGNLPKSLERFIGEMTSVKVDWRAVLRRFVTETSKNDYSWMRPSRHHVAHGMFLPSLYSENMGEMVVAIDTSGSIDQPTLDVFGAEITAIADNVRPSKLTIIYCDAAVNHVDEFGPGEPLHFKLHGGGGTDFRPPFEYVREHDLKPVCFVYLTDMYGSFPADPGFPVLWCATTDVEGPFGETIRIEV